MLKSSFVTILLLLFFIPSRAQVSGVVVEAENKKPIPYVNIGSMAKGYGTSCSLKGRFRISAGAEDSLTFSAVGFKTKTVAVSDLADTLTMEKQVSQLRAVEIRPGSTEEFMLGTYKANRIRYFWGGGHYPLLIARYFAFPKDTFKILFLDQLSVYTKSHIRGAKFNVRIYGVGPDGRPGDYLYDQNIFAYAKKGWKKTEVDLSDFHIVFPEEGVFIALETLRIEENLYSETVENLVAKRGDPVELELVRYAPDFGRLPRGTSEWGWRYHQGRWFTEKNENQIMPGRRDTPVAVELRLTN